MATGWASWSSIRRSAPTTSLSCTGPARSIRNSKRNAFGTFWRRQLPDGGWNIYPEGPSEVNATVKAYFALKLAGFSPDDPAMVKARERARALGGVEKTNTYARLYLALLGQVPWDAVPTIPVEFLIVPHWSPIHFYTVSSWTRSMVVPLAIINHYKITHRLPEQHGIKELYLEPEKTPRLHASGLKKLFIFVDRILKFCEKHQIHPFRRMRLQVAERWMIERIGDGNDGLAAIFPAMLNSMIALRCLGYHPRSSALSKSRRRL